MAIKVTSPNVFVPLADSVGRIMCNYFNLSILTFLGYFLGIFTALGLLRNVLNKKFAPEPQNDKIIIPEPQGEITSGVVNKTLNSSIPSTPRPKPPKSQIV